jgi:hypothetical protein
VFLVGGDVRSAAERVRATPKDRFFCILIVFEKYSYLDP